LKLNDTSNEKLLILKKECFMKKLLSTALIAVILSTTMIDTINAAIERRTSQRRTSRRGTSQRRTLARKRRALPKPRGKTSPEQLKKTAQLAERDAKKLQDDAKKSQTGKTSEETVVADAKKIEANINKIEQQLANLRTWSGDVLPGGYSLEEKNKAFDLAKPYIKESEALKARIKGYQSKIDRITTKTYFGFGATTVKPGEEKEHDRLTKLIKIDEALLAKYEPIIAQQEVIMGKRRSTAIKTAYGVMATAAIAVGADLYTGGAISGAAATQISSIASSISYYTPSFISSPVSWAATKLKAGWSSLRGTTPTTPKDKANSDITNEILETALKNKSTESDEESWFQSIILPGLQTLGVIAAKEVKKTLLQAYMAGARSTTNAVLKSLYVRLTSLSSDPTADPKEVMKTEKALKEELKKMKTEPPKKPTTTK
jgi:hypothetical protein